MPLPKISYPIFELTLPSTKQTIRYRPFLVREEKILLAAQTSGEPEDIVLAVRQVINNCIVTEGVDIEQLTTFDLEYMFIKIRAKSVNNIITLTYKDLEDDKRYDVEVDLDQIEMRESPEHNPIVDCGNGITMKMKYPKADIAASLKLIEGETDIFFEVLKKSIDTIHDATDTFIASDYSSEELDEFVQSLGVNSFKQIQEFFSTMPKLYYEVKYTNSLGKEKVIPLTSLNDFFTLG